jgi:hypothetical protein
VLGLPLQLLDGKHSKRRAIRRRVNVLQANVHGFRSRVVERDREHRMIIVETERPKFDRSPLLLQVERGDAFHIACTLIADD